MKSTPITSLAAFIKHIETLPRGTTLFRGQDNDYALRPGLARLMPRDGDLPTSEQRMLDDLKRQTLPWLAAPLSTDWDWLALAQHHRMATRLLDWSINPLAALWFAVQNPFEEKTPSVGDNCAVVWIFHPDEADFVTNKKKTSPFRSARTMVFQPDHISPRIVAQGGWFTVHKYTPDKEGSFLPLEKNRQYKSKLSKITLAPDVLAGLRAELRRCGIHSAFIYPGLDGLCGEIQRTHALLSDELTP